MSASTTSNQARAVGFLQSGSGATARTVQAKLRDWISVKDFGALGDGSTDDTSAIQAAINAIDTLNGGTVYFPEGSYKTTSTLTVAQSGTHIVGAGRFGAKILFAPTATDVCLSFTNGASMITRWSMRDISIYSDDSTYTKTAIEVIDGGSYLISDVIVEGSVTVGSTNFWSGNSNTSIGLHIKGREFGHIRNLWIVADRPILVGENPNNSIDLDHHDFIDSYLIANANPNIEFSTGIHIGNIKFGGAQAWVLGTHGFYWNDTTSATNDNQLIFENVRTEQGTSAAAYSIYIAHNTVLQTVSFRNSRFESGRNGIYLRNVRQATLDTVTYEGGSGKTAIDMTGITNSVLMLNNVVFAASSTATLTSLVRVLETRPTQTTYPIGEYAVYAFTGRDGIRLSQLASASLTAAPAANSDGLFLLEDCGSGQKNLVLYSTAIRNRARIGSGLVQMFDDFLGDVLADEWGSQAGTDPQVVAPAIVSAVGGAVRMTTGDDAAGTMAANGVQLQAALNWQANSGGLMCEFRVQMSAITNVAVFVGLTDQIAALEIPIESAASADTFTSNAADAVGVLFDTSMATDNWWLVGVSNTTPATAQNTALAPSAGTYETWRITVSTGGTATFYRNGTAVGSAMTGSTRGTVPLTPVVAALSRSTATRNIDVDHILVEQNRA